MQDHQTSLIKFTLAFLEVLLHKIPSSANPLSAASTQSDDIPVIASDPAYPVHMEGEMMNALHYSKHVFAMASTRLHTITQEGKLIAIQQLELLL